jgi:cytochrome c
MIRHRLSVFAGALLLCGAAAQAAAQSPSEARGHQIVAQYCGGCHAIGDTGDSPNAKAPHFRDLHLRYPVENLAEALAEGILAGHPEMPEFRFASDDVKDIIAYLKSVQTQEKPPIDAAP